MSRSSPATVRTKSMRSAWLAKSSLFSFRYYPTTSQSRLLHTLHHRVSICFVLGERSCAIQQDLVMSIFGVKSMRPRGEVYKRTGITLTRIINHDGPTVRLAHGLLEQGNCTIMLRHELLDWHPLSAYRLYQKRPTFVTGVVVADLVENVKNKRAGSFHCSRCNQTPRDPAKCAIIC